MSVSSRNSSAVSRRRLAWRLRCISWPARRNRAAWVRRAVPLAGFCFAPAAFFADLSVELVQASFRVASHFAQQFVHRRVDRLEAASRRASCGWCLSLCRAARIRLAAGAPRPQASASGVGFRRGSSGWLGVRCGRRLPAGRSRRRAV